MQGWFGDKLLMNLRRENRPAALPEPEAPFNEELLTLIPYLRAFARSLCRNKTEADDLTQEALTRAWRARSSFEPGTNMRAWLYKILRNSYYSDRRSARRQAVWSDEPAERLLVSDGSQRASLAISELHRAMATLPEEQREALILVGAGGVSYDEAAAICGCAVGTVKSRVARARRAVIAALDGEGPPLPSERTNGDDAMREISQSLEALMGGPNQAFGAAPKMRASLKKTDHSAFPAVNRR